MDVFFSGNSIKEALANRWAITALVKKIKKKERPKLIENFRSPIFNPTSSQIKPTPKVPGLEEA